MTDRLATAWKRKAKWYRQQYRRERKQRWAEHDALRRAGIVVQAGLEWMDGSRVLIRPDDAELGVLGLGDDHAA